MKLKEALMQASRKHHYLIQPTRGTYVAGLASPLELLATSKRNYEKRKAERWKNSLGTGNNNQ